MLVSLPFFLYLFKCAKTSVDLCHFCLIYSCPSTSHFENKQKWNPFSVLSFALILNHFQLGAGARRLHRALLCKNAVCFSFTLFWIYYFHVFIFNVFFFFSVFVLFHLFVWFFCFSLLLRFTFGMSDGVRKQQRKINVSTNCVGRTHAHAPHTDCGKTVNYYRDHRHSIGRHPICRRPPPQRTSPTQVTTVRRVHRQRKHWNGWARWVTFRYRVMQQIHRTFQDQVINARKTTIECKISWTCFSPQNSVQF